MLLDLSLAEVIHQGDVEIKQMWLAGPRPCYDLTKNQKMGLAMLQFLIFPLSMSCSGQRQKYYPEDSSSLSVLEMEGQATWSLGGR